MPELETVDEQRRLYPKDGFASHLIGYVGEVSEDMLNDPRYAMYEPGDVVGKSGVEESYDAILRGQDGSRDVLVDSHGREVGKLGTEPSKPGQSLKLTIDLDLQRTAENAFGDRNGAVIAMDPHTGEILAMLSRPTFRSKSICGAYRTGRVEPADHRPQPSAAEQDHPGAACAGFDIQGDHVAGRAARGCGAEPDSELRGGRDILRPLFCAATKGTAR